MVDSIPPWMATFQRLVNQVLGRKYGSPRCTIYPSDMDHIERYTQVLWQAAQRNAEYHALGQPTSDHDDFSDMKLFHLDWMRKAICELVARGTEQAGMKTRFDAVLGTLRGISEAFGNNIEPPFPAAASEAMDRGKESHPRRPGEFRFITNVPTDHSRYNSDYLADSEDSSADGNDGK